MTTRTTILAAALSVASFAPAVAHAEPTTDTATTANANISDAGAPDKVEEPDEDDSSIADFQLALGTDAAGSEWRGDFAAAGSLKLAFRFIDLIGPYVMGREGYALVDQRIITQLTLGAQIWGRLGITRPYARLGFIHQHEESLAVAAEDPATVVLGIGDGIRHRTGGELGVGLDIPFWTRDSLAFFAGIDAYAKLLPDDLGPLVQAGGGLNIGLNYVL